MASYLLIGFWSTRLAASNASMQAFLTNRAGDWFLAGVMYVCYLYFGSLEFENVTFLSTGGASGASGSEANEGIKMLGILILMASMGKSAQLGLHMWLPSSMEGPTPVSALIHAATLVTAGVFLWLRLSPLMVASDVSLWVGLVGGLTVAMAGLSALVQNDIKRVIAFSTMAQIGYIFLALSFGAHFCGVQHIVNHAFFKAMLFLSAGTLIHGLSDYQDLRRFGALRGLMGATTMAIVMGSLSLLAAPFFTGFYSKDLILEALSTSAASATSATSTWQAIYILATAGALLTAFYSMRLVLLVFVRSTASFSTVSKVHEGSLVILSPIAVLLLFSVGFGYFFKEWFVGLGSQHIGVGPILVDAEFGLSTTMKWVPFLCTLAGVFFAYAYMNSKSKKLEQLSGVLQYKFYLDVVINKGIVGPAIEWGLFTSKVLDRG